MPTLSDGELSLLANKYFGDLGPSVVEAMINIARAESGGRFGADAVGDNFKSGHQSANSAARYDYGPLQVNSQHGYDRDRLINDPEYNFAAGREIYDRKGIKAWATADKVLGGLMADEFDTDIGAMMQAVQAAWQKVRDYLRTHSDSFLDQKTGQIRKRVTPSAAAPQGDEIDTEGSAILTEAVLLEQDFDRATKTLPLYNKEFDAAKAFRDTATTRADLAQKAWENFVDRIKTLTDIEDIPRQQAGALDKSRQEAREALQKQLTSVGPGSSPIGPVTFPGTARPVPPDYSPFAESIRSSIPAEAPPFFAGNIPDAAPDVPKVTLPGRAAAPTAPAEVPAAEPYVPTEADIERERSIGLRPAEPRNISVGLESGARLGPATPSRPPGPPIAITGGPTPPTAERTVSFGAVPQWVQDMIDAAATKKAKKEARKKK